MRLGMGVFIGVFVCAALVYGAQDKIRLVGIHDPITPVTAHFLNRNLEEASLHLTGAEVVTVEMGTAERILNVISNPNVAYVLMMLGMMGLFFELASPGVILPGVIGGISLILSFFAFQALPVNYAGLLLILLGLILLIAEIKVMSHGVLTLGGLIAMVLGSSMLFESSDPYLRVSWSVIMVTVLAVAGLFAVVVTKVLAVHHRRPTTGREGLIGLEGIAESEIAPEGKVFIRGEYWDARSDETISFGSRVTVEAVQDMQLKVKKIS
jgi:membrane-bound serine protease (ClpP class)